MNRADLSLDFFVCFSFSDNSCHLRVPCLSLPSWFSSTRDRTVSGVDIFHDPVAISNCDVGPRVCLRCWWCSSTLRVDGAPVWPTSKVDVGRPDHLDHHRDRQGQVGHRGRHHRAPVTDVAFRWASVGHHVRRGSVDCAFAEWDAAGRVVVARKINKSRN